VVNTVSFNSSGVGAGTVTTTNSHDFTISGWVNTSHGRVNTTVKEQVNFKNVTNIALTSSNEEIQDEVQTSTVDSKTITDDGRRHTTHETHTSYPFTINLSDTFLTSGDVPQVTSIDQQYKKDETEWLDGFPVFHSRVSNEVTTQDSTEFVFANGGFSLGASTGQSSKQTYVYRNSLGDCFSRTLTATNLVLTKVKDDQRCEGFFGW
jgi:hypothetical protein